MVNNLLANAGNMGSIHGSGKTPEGNCNPIQYSCLENRGACLAAVHGVTKSWTHLVTKTTTIIILDS